MALRYPEGRGLSPGRVWSLVLLVLFAAESVVMRAIELVPVLRQSRLLETIVDAACLTCLAAPVIWWSLVRPLQAANQLRSQFLSDLFSSIEADRRRTASELHDGAGQSLTILISGLRSAAQEVQEGSVQKRCHHLEGLAVQVLGEVKRLALGLRPSILDDLGLFAALRKLVTDFSDQQSVSMRIVIEPTLPVRLPQELETTLFRISQEALTNIVSHSRATQAEVHLSGTGDCIKLSITDNGVGIRPEQLCGPNPGHLGIAGMRERASLLNGQFTIASGGAGTRIQVCLPVSKGTTWKNLK